MMHLVFSTERQFFGEIQTEQGMLKGIMLNQEGERLLGSQCETWQSVGIAMRREIQNAKPDGTREIVWYMERVLPRDQLFIEALRAWADEQQHMLIALENAYVPCWELLVRLPFESNEQFAFLIALRNTPQPLLGDWQTCLQEVLLLAQHEIAEGEQVASVMRKRLSGHLVRPFVQTT